jgi:DNA-binding transcriptional regulator YdaS (Cro superfamily)
MRRNRTPNEKTRLSGGLREWAEPDLNTPGNPSGKRTPPTKAAQNAAHLDAISTPTRAGGTPTAGTPERAVVGGDLPDDLRPVVEAWPHLPLAIRAGVLAMVKAAADTRDAGGRAS